MKQSEQSPQTISSKVFQWLFCPSRHKRKKADALGRLKFTMRATAKCRYHAYRRLSRQSKFSFFTTTILSLGLIFIPLMQNAGINLAFTPNVLGMMQIFLAVSILVYSVVIGTARYDVRAEQQNECGDRIKDLVRSIDVKEDSLKIRNNQKTTPEQAKKEQFKLVEKYKNRYADILSDTENHDACDYKFAMLDMPKDYPLTGLPYLKVWFTAVLASNLSLALPSFLLILEAIFILDMIGVTSIFVPFLSNSTPK